MGKGINNSKLPSEVSIWSKIRNFLCKEVEITEAELVLTPKQEKVFKEVHDFWNQEITGQKVHDFLFYDITGEKVKKFLFQEVQITDNVKL